MRVGILGINHKLADLKLREHLAKACQRRFGSGNALHGHHAFVLLSTCNRTEIYFSSEDLAATHTYLMSILRHEVQEEEFDQKLYSYFGLDCFTHLARVTAGLDSAILAETEIQGQVKKAYESAIQYHRIPGDLHYMFQKSLKIGKQVRSDFHLQRGLPDLEHAIYNTGSHLFKNPQEAKILFVGVSDINRKILHFLKAKNCGNISICNRSLGPALEIASDYAIKMLSWENLQHWHEYDWIIFGTKSPDFLIGCKDLPKQLTDHKLVMDLSVPRNVEPTIGRHPMINLMNIDQINHTLHIRKQKMAHILSKTEETIYQETRQHILLFKQKDRFRESLLPITA